MDGLDRGLLRRHRHLRAGPQRRHHDPRRHQHLGAARPRLLALGRRRPRAVDRGPPRRDRRAPPGDVSVVLLTHHHADHSEAAREYAERHGCGVRALDPAYRLGSEGLGEGDVVSVGDLEVHVVATPGHTADSLSFVVPQDRAVLTGDTVLGRGTTVVAHPDGQLGAYLSSLERLHALCGEQGITTVWPGHGPVIDDALGALDFYLAHRRAAARPGARRAARPARDRARGRRPSRTRPCRARSSRSSTPTSTRCCGVRPSCRCARSWPTSSPRSRACARARARREVGAWTPRHQARRRPLPRPRPGR